jgi:hypothetical protein
MKALTTAGTVLLVFGTISPADQGISYTAQTELAGR